MGCSCKSNSGIKRQATQVQTRTTQTTRVAQKTNKPERKQIVIRRPVR